MIIFLSYFSYSLNIFVCVTLVKTSLPVNRIDGDKIDNQKYIGNL